jgi:hypothetical protein
MTLLPTGEVLVAGGSNIGELDTRPAELYEPKTGQWTTTGAMLDERVFGHTATLLPTGKVLVVGGMGTDPLHGPLASAELYDPTTGQWLATAAPSAARVGHTATLLATGKVLVAGGEVIASAATAELYDPGTGTWTPAAPMLAERAFHTATLLPSGAVLVAGGSLGFPSSVPTEAELYDPASGTWRRTGSLPAPHVEHTATGLPSGRVLVVGQGPFSSFFSSNTELFDPESEIWSDAGCTAEPRDEHTATLLLSGAVLVAGGLDSSAELYGIVVSPAQVSVAPGASQTFTARGGSGFDYVWSFKQNNSEGTLTASGVYQAGTMGGVTDVVQVMDSFANSATATVNVTQRATTLAATSAHANSVGCGTTGGAALPSLAASVLVLLGWRSLRRLRHSRRNTAQKKWEA